MEKKTHERRRGATANSEIESAFSTMVGRWLVKGEDGKWKLAAKKKLDRAQLSRSAKCLKENPRKHLSSTSTGRGDVEGNRKQTKSTRRPARMSNKLTEDFFKRSKERSLPPDCSGLKPATPHHAGRPPNGTSTNITIKPTSGTNGTSPLSKSETRSEAPGEQVNTATQPSNRCDTKKEARAEEKRPAKDTTSASRTDGTSDGIPMLCNGQKKCKVGGCYRAAYKRGLCPGHGGRDQCQKEDCKNYSYTQGLCQAHGGGRLGTNIGDDKCTSTKAELVATKRTKSELNKSVAVSDSAAPKTKEPSLQTTKKRPKLQTTKKPSEPSNNDAWNSSDLPNLFRNAGHKRVRESEESVANLKREKVEMGVVEHDKRANSKVATRKVSRSPIVESEESVCTVRRCKMPVLSDGFCEDHANRKRCKEDGCGNLARKGTRGFCCRHATKECLVDGCTKKARVRGRCSVHGGKHLCREESCKKSAYLRGLCKAHGREAQNQPAR